LLLKAICPFGPGNVPAHALWLIGITERLGSNKIAEIAKRKANLVGIWESTTLLTLLLSMFVVAVIILFSRKGFSISIFK
jgi:hypothetical protein